MAPERRSNTLLLGIIFMMLTGYFVWNCPWYDPAVLEIKGSVSSISTGFDVAWDPGSGLNNYERYKVVLNTQSSKPVNQVQISNTGKKNGASLSKTIALRRIVADGHELPGSRIELTTDKPQIGFKVAANQSIAIELATNNRSGLARITVNGVSYERDLYIANIEAKSRTYDFWLVSPQNQFTVKAALPRYKINELMLLKRKDAQSIKLNSIYLLTGEKDPIPLLTRQQMLSKINLGSISHYQKRYFGWGRFIQQLLSPLSQPG